MKNDEFYIKRTFELARKAEGKTSPNPLVGCVIVRANKIISEGFHKKAGALHAEAVALNNIKGRSKGATLYVNLEPCFHWGRTSPCVDRIISAGIKRVVLSIKDPNPLVAGKSIKKLRAAGIEVKTNVLAEQAKMLNEVFFTNIKQKRPFVVLKAAQTLDGKIANGKGESKWITSVQSRNYARRLRGNYEAVLVGANTVVRDNPSLGARSKKISKVIIDPNFKISEKSNLFRNCKQVFIFVKKPAANKSKRNRLENRAKIIEMKYYKNGFSVKQLLNKLYSRGITSVFVEGGGYTLGKFLGSKIFDRCFYLLLPK